MELKIKTIDTQKKRLIVMSDLHGKLNLFTTALQQANFTTDDILIIVGDICEKGEHSLELLRTSTIRKKIQFNQIP